MSSTGGTPLHLDGRQSERARVARRRKTAARGRRVAGTTLTYVLLLAGAVLFMVPFVWMVSTSLKSRSEVNLLPIRWIPQTLLWSNYVDALFGPVPFLIFFKNTFIVVFADLLGDVFVCALVAYAFARMPAPGRTALFIIVLSTMMLPEQVLLVPTYVLYKQLHWIDRLYGLVVPNLLASGAFYIVLFRQFFQTIHLELDDAARIDGAGRFGIFRHVILPLSRPVLITVAIFSFFAHWNSFLWPVILLKSQENYTVAIGLRNFQSFMTESANLPQLMAASIVALAPCLIMFFVAQRYFVQGVVFTGVKG
ncbi:MAG: carbohydrate ABC transporter permease [Anaerolineae bacterium]